MMIHINWATECSECGREYRSDERIYQQSQQLAVKFYELLGYHSRPDFDFRESQHPTEIAIWEMVKLAQLELTDTDIDNLDVD